MASARVMDMPSPTAELSQKSAEMRDSELSVPELRRQVDQLVWGRENPQFFASLAIAPDGGLSEVGKLFVPTSFLWASLALVSAVGNVTYVAYTNINILTQSQWISSQASSLLIEKIFFSEIRTGTKPEVLVAFLELVLLLGLMGLALLNICRALRYRKSNPMRSWSSISYIFFDLIPACATFSSMGFLYWVTPSILIPTLGAEITGLLKRRGRRCGRPLLWFLLLRFGAFLVGFDAFQVKFRAAASKGALGGEGSNQSAWDALAFLNQVLGVVQVRHHVRWRLLVYIFGGEDGFINAREQLMQQAWHALLAQRVWAHSRKEEFRASTLWFCAVLLAYSDYDFQSLTLDEVKARASLPLCAAADSPEKRPGSVESEGQAESGKRKDLPQQAAAGSNVLLFGSGKSLE